MKKTYVLEDLDCPVCAAKMEAAIKKIAGVTAASVSFVAQRLTLETDGDEAEIMAKVKAAIAKVEPDCSLKE